MQKKLLKRNFVQFVFICLSLTSFAQEKIFPGADESTPSRSEYFSWINNTNEGATEAQTLINLDFFKWLKDEYGMQLDIYAFDAGAIDGKRFYGNMQSDRFKRQFPNGFAPMVKEAGDMGTRLGIWGGPDGFGDTPEEEDLRIETMVSLCRDHNFELFKMDGVCGQLRPEKHNVFNRMMNECRKYSPDLILLNHRLDLGSGMAHSTTFLLGGAETYIDVHIANTTTAPHHRAGAIARELPPKLTRLTEDHGVCLSSFLDYWEDDLVLQAFNRNLIVSPEIYGNPWLLRDNEYPLLARIFNLHRKYKDILVNGMVLPEKRYGINAVSRGDGHTRLLTLRNLSWEPVNYSIKLDSSVGLGDLGKVQVKTYHPTEKIIGSFAFGEEVEIEVLPFRSCLVKLSDAKSADEFGVEGTDYQIVPNAKNDTEYVQLLSLPGTSRKIKLAGDCSAYKSASIDGEDVSSLLKGKAVKVDFGGDMLHLPYHRKLAEMDECPVPGDAESIYEATCFAGSNNALEAQELLRSGETKIPQIQAARDAFFNQPVFKERELWDRNLFDGDLSTAYSINMRHNTVIPNNISLRLDMGGAIALDSLVVKTFDTYSLEPLETEEGNNAKVSADLLHWDDAFFMADKSMKIDMAPFGPIRYVKIQPAPLRITEIIGYKDGVQVDRSKWKASNLFDPYSERKNYYAQKTWSSEISLDEIPEGSYLCIAINGTHGIEGAYAGLKIDGEYFGCPDRAPAFKSNVWEADVRESDKNYTYYFPLDKNMAGKKIEVFVLGLNGEHLDLKPEIYITAYPVPFKKKLLILE